MNKGCFNLLMILALILLPNSFSGNVGDPIQVVLDIPDHLEEDFEKFSDLIDMGEVFS